MHGAGLQLLLSARGSRSPSAGLICRFATGAAANAGRSGRCPGVGTGGADASLSRSGAARSATRSAALTPRDRDWRCPMRPPGGAVTTRRCCPDPHRAAPGPRVAAEVRLSLGEPRGSARLPFSRGAAEGRGGGGGWGAGLRGCPRRGLPARRGDVGPSSGPARGVLCPQGQGCSRRKFLRAVLPFRSPADASSQQLCTAGCCRPSVRSHLSPRSARRLCADPQRRG